MLQGRRKGRGVGERKVVLGSGFYLRPHPRTSVSSQGAALLSDVGLAVCGRDVKA